MGFKTAQRHRIYEKVFADADMGCTGGNQEAGGRSRRQEGWLARYGCLEFKLQLVSFVSGNLKIEL
jgi:hypothetical protein